MQKQDKMNEVLDYLKNLIKGTQWEGHVFCVGGCVRDSLMGLPIKDIDLCVDRPNGGMEFATWVTIKTDCYRLGSNPVLFPSYGTAKFSIKSIDKFKNIDIECVQTRKEQYKDKNSRNPETVFGTLEEDCFRRDLTINSLYKNISSGVIIDLSNNGLADIKNKLIRTPCDPNITFTDDPLRMLRVIRFATRFGWGIDKDTFLAILNNSERIRIVSQERISDEINKILLCKKPSEGIRHLLRCNLLDKVLPDIYSMIDVGQNKYHFGSVFEHTLAVLDKTEPMLPNRLSGLFHDVGKLVTRTERNGEVHFYSHEDMGALMTETILRNMKYSNDIIKKVRLAVKNHMRLKSIKDNRTPSNKAIRKLQSDLGEDIDLVLDVINADNTSHAIGYNMPNQIKLLKEKIKEMNSNGKPFKVVLPIDGNTIIKEFDLKPSPIIGKLLEKVIDRYLDNPNLTKEQCLDIVAKELCQE